MIACQATLATDRSALNVLQDYRIKIPPGTQSESAALARAAASRRSPLAGGGPAGWMTFILIFERFSGGVDLKINAGFHIREGHLSDVKSGPATSASIAQV